MIALLALLQCHTLAQPACRRAQLDEAEQLALDAQDLDAKWRRMHFQNKATAAEIHAKAVDSMSRAIAIWDGLDVPNLVGRGLSELSRLQITFGDVDAAVATARRLVEHWHARGNVQKEGDAYFELATRIEAGRQCFEALAGWEQTIAFAQANHLDFLYANALRQKANWLKAQGRESEAEAAQQAASKAMTEAFGSTKKRRVDPEAQMPERWVDVPAAPMFAELLVLDKGQRLALTNRSTKFIESASLGCATDDGGQWRLGRPLFSIFMNHGGVGPNGHFDVTRAFAGTRTRWTDRPMGCEEGRPTVVEVLYADGTKWRLATDAPDEGGR
ncbi:hypothetical protein [Roseateles sp. LYH14W]|uniref:Uncharacterized protein n=1 Tax=Pelomonas parva TaxID=3299032 RepID=A0ABW7F8J9_9BURK